MSRDANGNYTLPAGNPVVTGTIITSTWANATLPDLGTEMTDSLSRSGKGGMLAPLKIVDSDGPTPGLAFANELTSGLRRAGPLDVRILVNGIDLFIANGSSNKILAWENTKSIHVPVVTEATDVRENECINGYFDVWQRWDGPQITSGYDADDRWENAAFGSGQTVQRAGFDIGQLEVPGHPTYYSRNDVASVVGPNHFVRKTYKAPGVGKYAGQRVHVAFYARTESPKPIAIEFFFSYGTGGSPTGPTYGIGSTQVNLTTGWTEYFVSADMPSLAGVTLGSLRDDYFGVNFWYDAGTDFNSRTASLGHQGGTFDIAAVRIGFGETLPNYRRRSFEDEFNLCLPFYERSYNIESPTGAPDDYNGVVTGEVNNIGQTWSPVRFNRSKRYPPSTISCYSPETGAKDRMKFDLPSQGGDIPVDILYVGETGFTVQNQGVLTPDIRYMYHWVAEAEILT